MSEKEEHIDNFFKENIDKVNVQYNAAHWDKLQKSLLVASAVGVTSVIVTSKWQAILKFLKLYKLFFIGIPSIAIVTTSVIYFTKTDQEINRLIRMSITDSTSQTVAPAVIPDTQSPQLNNSFFNKQYIHKDSPVYVSPYQTDTTKKVFYIKKDSVISTKKDSVLKKKNLNVFW